LEIRPDRQLEASQKMLLLLQPVDTKTQSIQL